MKNKDETCKCKLHLSFPHDRPTKVNTQLRVFNKSACTSSACICLFHLSTATLDWQEYSFLRICVSSQLYFTVKRRFCLILFNPPLGVGWVWHTNPIQHSANKVLFSRISTDHLRQLDCEVFTSVHVKVRDRRFRIIEGNNRVPTGMN